MRKDAKKDITPNLARVSGYHGGNFTSQSYAYEGFNETWYYNSDRKEKTVVQGGQLIREKSRKPLDAFGLEVEVQCSQITNSNALAEVFASIICPKFKFGTDMFKMQEDGSLGGHSSLELITQPMTKGRIRNDYGAWKQMFNHYFNWFGISADSYNTSCGMHVNISNAVFGKTPDMQDEAIKKLVYVLEKHYDFFLRMFYRNPNRTTYCKRWNYTMDDCKHLNLRVQPNDHYKCINLSHYRAGRIEIRLVGGQANYYCFRNTMECVFHLVENIGKVAWNKLDDLYEIFKGCNQYVMKRINGECRDYIPEAARIKLQAEHTMVDLELVDDVNEAI